MPSSQMNMLTNLLDSSTASNGRCFEQKEPSCLLHGGPEVGQCGQ
jgi:hypothetical protein